MVLAMNYAEHLSKGFPVHLVPEIVAKIRQGYEENHDYHDPSLGHGPASYGMHVHDTVCYRLKELEEEPGVDTQSKFGSVEIVYGPFVLRPYKLGYSEEDDVWTSRPYNVDSTALRQMANHNQVPPLPGLGWPEPSNSPTDFVIGHFGAYDEEHSEGCRAIYLCVPWYVDDQFVGWRDCIQVYNASEEGDLGQESDELPPVEETEEPEVGFADEVDERPEPKPIEEPDVRLAEDELSSEEGE